MNELYTPDLMIKTNVIMTRIRLARNLNGYPFRITDKNVSGDIVKAVKKSVAKCGEFDLYYLSDFDDIALECMKERHLISTALINNKKHAAVLINKEQTVSVMVHEEDVLREQCFVKGFNLGSCYRRLSAVDNEICKNLDVAFSEKYGYLTACPTNVGTGLRASVMIFLPALTESGKIKDISEILKEKGLTIRGVYGEGSKAEGYIYQVSNETTLGVTEQTVINEVQSAVETICELERKELDAIYKAKNLEITDRARRAYGILSNAVVLTYSEFLEYVSMFKLGAMLGIIEVGDINVLDDLQVNVRPANLCEMHNRELTETEMDFYRADLVRKTVKEIVIQ